MIPLNVDMVLDEILAQLADLYLPADDDEKTVKSIIVKIRQLKIHLQSQ
jgi:hypothetical protein